MIPHSQKAITFLAQRLLTHVLPEQRTHFGVADVALLGVLFEMVSQDFDRAASARLEDVREMRGVFAEARARRLELPGALVARMDEAESRDLSDVRISRLDEVHALHSAVLIELHARVESLTGADAARVDRSIWEHLERHAELHKYDVNF